MIDERKLLERALKRFPPESGIVERVQRRRERKRRNERIFSTIVALILAAAAVGGAISMFHAAQRRTPASRPITPSNVGDLRVEWSASVGSNV